MSEPAPPEALPETPPGMVRQTMIVVVLGQAVATVVVREPAVTVVAAGRTKPHAVFHFRAPDHQGGGDVFLHADAKFVAIVDQLAAVLDPRDYGVSRTLGGVTLPARPPGRN